MLAVFPGDFDLTAAAAVWEVCEDQTLEGLGELTARSMIRYDPTSERYRLHDLMRDVARLPLEPEDEAAVGQRLEEASARHADHYCALLKAADDLYQKGSEHVLAGLALYDSEQRNVAAGQAWAEAHMPKRYEAVWLAAGYVKELLNLRMHPRQLIAWLEAQLRACSMLLNTVCKGSALNNLGFCWRALGENRRALEYYQQWLEIAGKLGNRRGECHALNNLGSIWLDLDEARRALGYLEQALAIAQEIGDRRQEGATPADRSRSNRREPMCEHLNNVRGNDS